MLYRAFPCANPYAQGTTLDCIEDHTKTAEAQAR
jgi:hypothetical protein